MCFSDLFSLNHSEGICSGSISQSTTNAEFAEDVLQPPLLRKEPLNKADSCDPRTEEEVSRKEPLNIRQEEIYAFLLLNSHLLAERCVCEACLALNQAIGRSRLALSTLTGSGCSHSCHFPPKNL